MIDKEKAKIDPTSVFAKPSDVLKEDSLSHHEKVDLLRRWAYDEREMAVAEEENMPPTNDQSNVLDEILKCLLELGAKSEDPKSPPTKQR